ncbi:MAG TPA: amidohydrolase family protein [Longimicrobiaceae bacterium]|nr:amidohydrolase family protein [Longimicrobiaceae bacterium]
MFILIENGELYAPEPRGRGSVLVANQLIEKVGEVDRRALDALGVEYEAIDAGGCVVAPGFLDPHQHLLGGSGEGSLSLQSPMLFLHEIVPAGITSVVGTLGVDTTMKTISGLLARVKALAEEGLESWMWTGGYNVPPTTVMGSVRDDLMFVDEVVGAGEVAISDERSLNQSRQELASLVRDTHVGGLLSGKAGVTHFHVGEEDTRLGPLREIIEDFQVRPEWLYPTHVQRSGKLLDEAIDLAKAGAHVDFDTVEQDLAKWFRYYLDHGGPLDRLTISSDADSGHPLIYFEQFRSLVLREGQPLERVLPIVGLNPARAVRLDGRKGTLEAGKDADIVVLDRGTLDVREVIARGNRMVRDGEVAAREKFLESSFRRIRLTGDRADDVRRA